MELSILICTLESRLNFLQRVYANIDGQIKRHNLQEEVEILIHQDRGEKSIGTKRNELIEQAKGKYVCFVDDDDNVSPFYVMSIYKGCQQDKDCCSLTGLITVDGRHQKKFTHSLQYKEYKEVNKQYFRPPNHLNPIRKTIAEKFRFKEKNFGEDTDWAMRISKAGAIKTEAVITVPLYFYLYRSRK